MFAVVLLTVVAIAAVVADDSAASKSKLQKSTSVVAWYEGKGWWHLRPGFDKCWGIRWDLPTDRCKHHRKSYRFHLARVEALTPEPPTDWASIQIHYATLIAQASGADPWPNCRDPFDGSGASWYDTVACENSGNWLDSPGYYRCGLQFDPGWEAKYGVRFCP